MTKSEKPVKPLAYAAYQKLADAYAAKIDTKPHNAFYDRPAMLSLLPKVRGLDVLDVGCGPGAYAGELAEQGARVLACDISERMLDLARERLKRLNVLEQVRLKLIDLSKPLDMIRDETFDVVNAPLCVDYVEDWHRLFAEFFRVLRPGGIFLFSCGHPMFDAQYYKTDKYFSVEQVKCTWTGFGIDVEMPSYRRSLEEMMMPVIQSGFKLDRIHEPLPTDDFKRVDLMRYKSLMFRPSFLCVRAVKP